MIFYTVKAGSSTSLDSLRELRRQGVCIRIDYRNAAGSGPIRYVWPDRRWSEQLKHTGRKAPARKVQAADTRSTEEKLAALRKAVES
jgi:hypothetical protein